MPLVIGRAVHLHPVVTIFAVLVGLSVAGILGGLLGVPVAAAIGVIFDEFFPAYPEAAPPPVAEPRAAGRRSTVRPWRRFRSRPEPSAIVVARSP